MPGIGTHDQYGITSDRMQRLQTIVDSGIHLYELRYPMPKWFGPKLFGYWNVKVFDELNQRSLKIIYRQKWFTDNDAYIEFHPNKRGICTAWCPHDKFWHNKLLLAEHLHSGQFNVTRLHMRDSSVSSNIATAELMAIAEFLGEWKVINNAGKVILRTKIEAEANDAAEKEGFKVEYGKIAAAEELIGKYKNIWMQSPEFSAIILPQIKQAVVDKTRGMENSVESTAISLIDEVDNMTEDQRRKLVEKLFGKGMAAQVAMNAVSSVPQESDTLGGELSSPEMTIDDPRISMPQVRSIAKSYGIKIARDSKKDELVAAIKAKIDGTYVAPEGDGNDDDDDDNLAGVASGADEMEAT